VLIVEQAISTNIPFYFQGELLMKGSSHKIIT